MMFSLAKETMEKTKLWQIVHRMPKGALLHAHLDAMVDFDYLLNVVMETPGMHIASLDTHLGTPETRREANVSIRFKEQREGDVEPGAGRSIWSDQEGEYKPGTYILLTRAADAFPEGGRQGFLRWLKSRCTLSQTDAMEQHHGPAEIWRKFMKCFGVIASFLHYEPVWRAFLRRLMSLLMADGVFWTEIRYVLLLFSISAPELFTRVPASGRLINLTILLGGCFGPLPPYVPGNTKAPQDGHLNSMVPSPPVLFSGSG